MTEIINYIRIWLEGADVWVITPEHPELPDLLLPEYGWLFTTDDTRARLLGAKAVRHGVRVALVKTTHEALLTVSLWQAEQADVSRAKYLTQSHDP